MFVIFNFTMLFLMFHVPTLRPTLPDTFVGTFATSTSPFNVGLHDPKYRRAKNNIERGRGARDTELGSLSQCPN